eukprot:6281363-Prymnesium_polylepis.1
MQNKGRLLACDVSEALLQRAAQRHASAGVTNVQHHLIEEGKDKWLKRRKRSYDRVGRATRTLVAAHTHHTAPADALARSLASGARRRALQRGRPLAAQSRGAMAANDAANPRAPSDSSGRAAARGEAGKTGRYARVRHAVAAARGE